jgi:YVTN family beta-propeller protein
MYPDDVLFDGTSIWVANSHSNNVMKLDPRDGSVLKTVAVGDVPGALGFDGSKVWVANQYDDTVTVVHAADGMVKATLRVRHQPAGIAFDGRDIWVSDFGTNGSVDRRAAKSGKYDGSLFTGERAAVGICFDGTSIWVANFGSDNVTKLSPSR